MILLAVYAPLVAGLLCLLLHRGMRTVPLLAYLATAAVALTVLGRGMALELHLTGSFGISLLLDESAAWFLLLNAVVSIAVALHERPRGRHHYFFILLAMLHGCLNACFMSRDLFNLYVVIELTTIIAFLLMGQGMTTRHLWNALRYLFLSNVGMLFFLLGTLLVYESSGSFELSAAATAPPTARALIAAGLLVKGGLFLPGLWLPQAHSEAEAAVSALLSGVVVKIGLLPLLRLEACSADLAVIIRSLGFGSIFLGLGLAICQRDVKRLLACSTISQVGFILLSPTAGAAYAFAHGVAKAALFLSAGSLPDRDLTRLQPGRLLAWPMALAALSIAGAPLLFGFHAKQAVSGALSGWVFGLATAASIGTAAVMTPLILAPWKPGGRSAPGSWQAPALLAGILLSAGLYAGLGYAGAWAKAVAVILAGMAMHRFILKRLMSAVLPDGWERLEHVVGMTCVVLIMIIAAVYLP